MRTVIDLDDDLLDRAAAELGTTTKKDTVNTALKFFAERPERMRRLFPSDNDTEAERLLRLGIGEDIADPEVRRQARR